MFNQDISDYKTKELTKFIEDISRSANFGTRSVFIILKAAFHFMEIWIRTVQNGMENYFNYLFLRVELSHSYKHLKTFYF